MNASDSFPGNTSFEHSTAPVSSLPCTYGSFVSRTGSAIQAHPSGQTSTELVLELPASCLRERGNRRQVLYQACRPCLDEGGIISWPVSIDYNYQSSKAVDPVVLAQWLPEAPALQPTLAVHPGKESRLN